MSGDPVAAVTEAEATGETAALFSDIRETLGVPVVNLVWRHLATMPGALPWVWGTVRPLYRTAALDDAVAAFRQRMILPATPALPGAVLDAMGLSAADRAGIEGVLSNYDHSNTVNLLTLGTFLAHPEGAAPPGKRAAPPALAPAPPLPRLLTLQEMAAATATLVAALNLMGERDEGRILASMWRHLAHWPPVLGLAWTILAPLEAAGSLRGAVAANLAQAGADQGQLAGILGRADPPAAPARAEALAALRIFVAHPIGKMVTICRILRQSLPAPAAR